MPRFVHYGGGCSAAIWKICMTILRDKEDENLPTTGSLCDICNNLIDGASRRFGIIKIIRCSPPRAIDGVCIFCSHGAANARGRDYYKTVQLRNLIYDPSTVEICAVVHCAYRCLNCSVSRERMEYMHQPGRRYSTLQLKPGWSLRLTKRVGHEILLV